MRRSAIEWTDFSGGNLNFVRRGKTDCECSPGCDHCYARRIGERFDNLPDVTTCYPEKLRALLKQKFPQDGNRRGAHTKPMCFVCDTGDLFHPNVPADFIVEAFEIMDARKDVIWQVLTKRPERMASVLFGEEGNWYLGGGDYLSNVWLGVSAENQEMADRRIPILVEHWVGTKFVSIEPCLGPVDLDSWLFWYVLSEEVAPNCGPFHKAPLPMLNWVIVGGETGPNARPMHPEWARAIRDQCVEWIPFFFKAWGEWTPYYPQGLSLAHRQQTYQLGQEFFRIGKQSAGRLLDGQEWSQWPEDRRHA